MSFIKITSCFTATLGTDFATSFFHSGPHISACYELTICLGLVSTFCKKVSALVLFPLQVSLSFSRLRALVGVSPTQPHLPSHPVQDPELFQSMGVYVSFMRGYRIRFHFLWLRKCIINMCCIFICVPMCFLTYKLVIM